MEGVAQSNARVSAYMRNVDASEWLQNPRLEIIQTTEKQERRAASFKLHVGQTTPKKEKGGAK